MAAARASVSGAAPPARQPALARMVAIASVSSAPAEGVSCPVSTPGSGCGWLILVEEGLEGAVEGRVVGEVVLPAAPDDVCPGAGQDADGVGVVAAAGDGFGVEVGCPGVGAAGVAGEVAQGVAQLFVGSPAEG